MIKKFTENRDNYKLLCEEVSFILKKELAKKKVEYSSISHRAKTLNSFIEKNRRKKYKYPFKDITDFAGVRIVFLYTKDYDKIEKIIKDKFDIIEKVDKLNEKEVDQFGYGAIHFVIRLGRNYKGARYDDIKPLTCEIQVRTILQDAWAIIDHHLVYKNEKDVPEHLRRKLNSLAGLFETADDQFLSIRNERNAYLKEIKEVSKTPLKFLDLPLNIDSFYEFLKWRYPKFEKDFDNLGWQKLYHIIDKRRYRNLNDLNIVHELTEKDAKRVKKERDFESDNAFHEFIIRLITYDKDFRKKDIVNQKWVETLDNLKIKGFSRRPKMPK